MQHSDPHPLCQPSHRKVDSSVPIWKLYLKESPNIKLSYVSLGGWGLKQVDKDTQVVEVGEEVHLNTPTTMARQSSAGSTAGVTAISDDYTHGC